jgi:hypothetical protein
VKKAKRLIMVELTKEVQQAFDIYGTESYISFSNTPFVQERIQKLKSELDNLKESIRSAEASPILDIIEKYSSKYPSHSFSDWFVKWGQKMLRNYGLTREKICGAVDARGGKGRKLFFEQPMQPISTGSYRDQECKEITKRGTRGETEIFEIVPKGEVGAPQNQRIVIPKNQRKRNLNPSRMVQKKKREEVRIIDKKDIPKECESDPLTTVEEVKEALKEEEEKTEDLKGGIFLDFREEVWRLFSPLEM